MSIQAIIFDFGGTLDSHGIDWFKRFRLSIEKKVGPIDEAVFEKYIRLSADGIAELPDTPALSMEGTVRRLCEHIQRHMAADAAELAMWLDAEVADEFIAEALPILEANIETIDSLSRHYRLGCVSNNWGNVAGWCRDFKLDGYFETMIDSAVVGSRKPDARIFQAALDEMHLPPEQCAYVGDNYDCDVIGSHAIGMRPVWITPPSSLLNGGPVTPLRITRLNELLNVQW